MMASFSKRYPRTTVALALVVAASVVAYLGVHLLSKPGRPQSLAYFYNVKTRILFSASDQLLPPIDTESGPATGVKAYVFSCGDSKNPAGRFIAFLEKMTPEAREAAYKEIKANESPLAMGFFLEQHQNVILVRSTKSETWYPKFSPEGWVLMKAGKESGGCAHPVLCLP